MTDPHEPAARRKAILWSALAGAAQLALAVGAPPSGSFLANALVAIGWAFVLPSVAVLHAAAAAHRRSGAILASLLGTAVVVIGMSAATEAALRPALLVLVGMWWWTLGKMAAETGILPRAFGVATAGLGALALAGGLAAPGMEIVARAVLGVWLLVLAALFARPAR